MNIEGRYAFSRTPADGFLRDTETDWSEGMGTPIATAVARHHAGTAL